MYYGTHIGEAHVVSLLIDTVFPGQLASQHLNDEAAKGPDVCREAVPCLLNDLGCHEVARALDRHVAVVCIRTLTPQRDSDLAMAMLAIGMRCARRSRPEYKQPITLVTSKTRIRFSKSGQINLMCWGSSTQLLLQSRDQIGVSRS